MGIVDKPIKAKEQLVEFLHSDNCLTKGLEIAEQKTGVDRLYLFGGFVAVSSLYLAVGYAAGFIVALIGFIYPAYASVKAIEDNNKEDGIQWLTYWVVYSSFSIVEFFSGVFLSWFPLYYLFKCVFLCWCMAPFSGNGRDGVQQQPQEQTNKMEEVDKPIKEKLVEFLHSDNYLTKGLEIAELKTGVDRLYLFGGCVGVLSLYLAVGYASGFIAALLGFLYPAYASVKAIQNDSKEDGMQWLIYWVVYSTISIGEFFSGIFLPWLPQYYLFKCVFLCWCMTPFSWNGSEFIYHHFIQPLVMKLQSEGEQVAKENCEQVKKVVTDVYRRFIQPFLMKHLSRAEQLINQATQAVKGLFKQGKKVTPDHVLNNDNGESEKVQQTAPTNDNEESEKVQQTAPTNDNEESENVQQTTPTNDNDESERLQPTTLTNDNGEWEKVQQTTPTNTDDESEKVQDTTPTSADDESEIVQQTTPSNDNDESEKAQLTTPANDNEEWEKVQQTAPTNDNDESEKVQQTTPTNDNDESEKVQLTTLSTDNGEWEKVQQTTPTNDMEESEKVQQTTPILQ